VTLDAISPLGWRCLLTMGCWELLPPSSSPPPLLSCRLEVAADGSARFRFLLSAERAAPAPAAAGERGRFRAALWLRVRSASSGSAIEMLSCESESTVPLEQGASWLAELWLWDSAGSTGKSSSFKHAVEMNWWCWRRYGFKGPERARARTHTHTHTHTHRGRDEEEKEIPRFSTLS
jgi:hypothetical protein